MQRDQIVGERRDMIGPFTLDQSMTNGQPPSSFLGTDTAAHTATLADLHLLLLTGTLTCNTFGR